jgi:DNA polymerase-3 subunit epsilon
MQIRKWDRRLAATTRRSSFSVVHIEEANRRSPHISRSSVSFSRSIVLHLERPLTFFDLEATGTDPQEARVIQIGMQRFVPAPDGAALDDTVDLLVDPQQTIPEAVVELTGLAPDVLRQASPFEARVNRIVPLLEDADLAGYNALAYDLPLLEAEFERCGRPLPGPDDRVVLDPYRLEQVLRPRTLSALYERYTDTPLDDAHDALRDVEAAGMVLQQQLAEHDLEGTPADLAEYVRGDYLDDQRRLKEDGDAVVVCFGKHDGKTLRELQTNHPDYFDWMYRTIDDLRPHIDDALE